MPTLDEFLIVVPVDARAGLRKALFVLRDLAPTDDKAAKALLALGDGLTRSYQRYTSDSVTDGKRRALVGARVSIADYWRYRRAAQAQGLSLYRWMVNAMDDAVFRQASEAPPPGG